MGAHWWVGNRRSCRHHQTFVAAIASRFWLLVVGRQYNSSESTISWPCCTSMERKQSAFAPMSWPSRRVTRPRRYTTKKKPSSPFKRFEEYQACMWSTKHVWVVSWLGAKVRACWYRTGVTPAALELALSHLCCRSVSIVCLIVRHGDRDPFWGHVVTLPPPFPFSSDG